MWLNLTKFPADLVTFTEEVLNGKLHFLCSVIDLEWEFAHWIVFTQVEIARDLQITLKRMSFFFYRGTFEQPR